MNSHRFNFPARLTATLLVLFACSTALTFAAEDQKDPPDSTPAGDTDDLAKKTQNPVANLISLPLQNNFNFGVGSKNATQWVLNVQPVIPFKVSEDWNLITRTIVPIINQPSPEEGVSSAFGLGDINPTLFLSPSKDSGVIWGLGPTLTIPTGTDPLLTSGKWAAGPGVVVLTMQGKWVLGALANHQWDFAGWRDRSYNRTLIQPFLNLNLPASWYLFSAPIFTADWENPSGEQWVAPLGAGVGKIVRFGKLPVNLQLSGYYNVEKPPGGPDWQLRFQVQFLFPK